ncbi:MAG: hypothetical protein EBW14_21255, partial [Oxalobacteraceae bacterium]|nr:hypothetical protein [Oxalobacteraceae bacterium]
MHSLVGAAIAALSASVTYAQGSPVKIGVLATLEGPFAAGGADGMRGAELAIRERGGVVAGRKIEMIRASSNANPDVAVNAVRKLVEQDKVDIVVGPLSGGEGIAVKDYSKSQPSMTFINGGSGAQATTLVNPSTNFFRFNTEGAQWMVGLGKAAIDKENVNTNRATLDSAAIADNQQEIDNPAMRDNMVAIAKNPHEENLQALDKERFEDRGAGVTKK